MPRKAKSQWEFGELFTPRETHAVLSVSELTLKVRRLLEKEVGRVWVSGEVTNLRVQSSGHVYFTLKDAGAQLSCVLFRGEPVPHRELLQDGQKLVLEGEVTVYEARGQYQLIVRGIELLGIGALQLAFEKLKQKLQAEGLFAPERKRPIPRYPNRIGIVTSPTGAALRDVLHVLQRRHPGFELLLAPCRVQGQGAAEEIAGAIELLNDWSARQPANQLDLILLTRGGGSLEDLWSFNEESVARAIFHSALPVVSAVGHEIDVTISDFVADFRAATPSAAAELLSEGYVASRRFVMETVQDLWRLARQSLVRRQEDIRQVSGRLWRVHPRRQIQERQQYVDDLQSSLARCVKQGWRDQRLAWQTVAQRLWRVRPSLVFRTRKREWAELAGRFFEKSTQAVRLHRQKLDSLQARLRLLSPDNVLNRGYSITRDARSGRIIRAAAEVEPGQELKTRLKVGEIGSTAH